jgi:hypothetical protein
MVVAIVHGIELYENVLLFGGYGGTGPAWVRVDYQGYSVVEVADIPNERGEAVIDQYLRGLEVIRVLIPIVSGIGVGWLISRLWPAPKPVGAFISE